MTYTLPVHCKKIDNAQLNKKKKKKKKKKLE